MPPDEPGRPADPGPGPWCPHTVDRPVMTQRWERLTFLHWAYDPADVQRLLPAPLRAQTFGDVAWVGLVPFFMRVATPGGRRAAWVSHFPETNVRTYALDADGRPGIWFLSLDAARLGAVVVARTGFRLPYFWSAMNVAGRDGELDYICRRRWPRPAPVSSRVRIRVGDPFTDAELDARDHFLTARWALFSVAGSRVRYLRAWHEPWPLQRAEVTEIDDGLVAAAGLPPPEAPPLVHYSPGVDVRIGGAE